MTDSWGVANYFVTTPTSTTYDYILATGGTTTPYMPTTGKMWGYTYTQDASANVTYNGVTQGTGSVTAYINNGAYGNHWDVGNRFTSGSMTAPDGTTINPNIINNCFGYFAETEQNHHFGKCGGTSGSDTSFGTASCDAGATPSSTAGLVPHSFNGGDGRVLQWFML